jgi:hypothetical protein
MISHQANQSLRIPLEQLKQEVTYWVCLGVLEQGQAGGQLVYQTVNLYVDRRKETQQHQPVTQTGDDEGITILQKSGGLSSFVPRT